METTKTSVFGKIFDNKNKRLVLFFSLMAKYRFKARTTKAKKQFEKLKSKGDWVVKKLRELQEDPRKRKGAHRLKQNLKGYWGAKFLKILT